MAELAIGVIGLAGLFSSALDAVQMADLVADKDIEINILRTQLENQKVRFMTWGSCGHNIGQIEALPGEEGAMIRQATMRTVATVIELFNKIKSLGQRHDFATIDALQPCGQFATEQCDRVWTSGGGLQRRSNSSSKPWVQESGSPYEMRTPSQVIPSAAIFPSRQNSVRKAQRYLRGKYTTIRWVASDVHRLSKLVAHLKDLNDDLCFLTQLSTAERNESSVIRSLRLINTHAPRMCPFLETKEHDNASTSIETVPQRPAQARQLVRHLSLPQETKSFTKPPLPRKSETLVEPLSELRDDWCSRSSQESSSDPEPYIGTFLKHFSPVNAGSKRSRTFLESASSDTASDKRYRPNRRKSAIAHPPKDSLKDRRHRPTKLAPLAPLAPSDSLFAVSTQFG